MAESILVTFLADGKVPTVTVPGVLNIQTPEIPELLLRSLSRTNVGVVVT